MANLIPVGTTAATSSDFNVGAGIPTTIHLTQAKDGQIPMSSQLTTISIYIEIKAASGTYLPLAALTANTPALVVAGVGTYRVRRELGGIAVGVDQD